jgi:hypothetical protein
MLSSCVNPEEPARVVYRSEVRDQFPGDCVSCLGSVESTFKIFYVLVGAFGAALYTTDSPSAANLIERMFPGQESHIYVRIDFVLVVLFSAFLAFLYDPVDQGKCVIAGFSGVALLKQVVPKWTRQRKGPTR